MQPRYQTRSGLQIGRLYIPIQSIERDADALRLQRALLGEKARVDWDGMVIVLTVLFAVLAIGFWG